MCNMYILYHVLDCWYLGNPIWPIIQGTTSNPFLFISAVQRRYSSDIILRNIQIISNYPDPGIPISIDL